MISQKVSPTTLALMALGKRIKDMRIIKGQSQVAFARDCGMEKSSMCKIEAGKINISYLTLHKIGSCLGVELKELV